MPGVCGGQERGRSAPTRGSPQPVCPGRTQLGTIVCSLHSQHRIRRPWGGGRGVSAEVAFELGVLPACGSFPSARGSFSRGADDAPPLWLAGG